MCSAHWVVTKAVKMNRNERLINVPILASLINRMLIKLSPAEGQCMEGFFVL